MSQYKASDTVGLLYDVKSIVNPSKKFVTNILVGCLFSPQRKVKEARLKSSTTRAEEEARNKCAKLSLLIRHVLKAVYYFFPYTALVVYVIFNVLYNMLLHPMLAIAKYLPAIARKSRQILTALVC